LVKLISGRGHVFFRRGHAFAEKVLLHLLDDDFLILAAGGVETIFIEQHLAELRPPVPCLLRDIVIDFLAQFAVEGRLLQTGEFFLSLTQKTLCSAISFLAIRDRNYLTSGRRGARWPSGKVLNRRAL